ncbi:MAG: quinohemoprotein ethanol dehydrogenase [Actinomycetota bacterium]|nr:quinohemoprotein ethanol dehydrogenase [Actinomycetota bacterium]
MTMSPSARWKLSILATLTVSAAALSAVGGPASSAAATASPRATATVATVTAGAGAQPAPVTVAIGKAVFKANCGGCHTLANAKTHGTVGPNLDKLKPSQKRVIKQVTNGGRSMPSFAGRLTVAKIASVAKYVSSVAGKKSSGGTSSPGGLP